MGGRGAAYLHTKGNDDKQLATLSFFNDPETEYQNQMFHKLKEFNISTRKSTDDIDDKILERQQTQIYNIAKKYNYILKETSSSYDIQFGSENIQDEKIIGFCKPTLINGSIVQRIVLDKKQFSNYDKITKAVEKGVNDGHFVPINTKFKSRDYLITHEFGHGIENSIYEFERKKENKILNYNNYLEFREQKAIEIKNKVIEIWEKKYTTGKKDDKVNLSIYSGVNAREWFAETFTNLELAEKPAPIALALKEFLEEFN